MKNQWYKTAIIYSLDVETFLDSDGDGIGDFAGLTQQLNYLCGLGITCLWLLPFYPSPNRDNGYDVMDYYNVDPRLGTLGDFVEFMEEAKELGLRVIIDLVVNHTSNQHPWFQASRQKHPKYHDYYVWSENPVHSTEHQPSFPGIQDSIWDYDEVAKAYYLHHFYKEQPDLNIGNPAVRAEIRKIMGFWLELGVSGFRIDAAPFLIEAFGMKGETDAEELRKFIPEMREFVSERRADAILLAEANVEPEQIPFYFGNGEGMQMLFSFLLNQYVFKALALEQADAIAQGLNVQPDIPPIGQWVNFLRHHDELTLDKLSKPEQQEIFQAFAPEENMQIFGRGIRRRLAPMLKNDRRRLELAYSLLFSLPGSPLVRYGDEIAMGDDLSLEERNSVRTVMQWSNSPNGGFSTAPSEALGRPTISGGEYGYERVNVRQQQRDPQSFLNWMERAIRTRKQCPEFGRGQPSIVETDRPQVFAHSCTWEGSLAIAVHNLSETPCRVTFKLSSLDLSQVVEVFGDRLYAAPDSQTLELEGYGYRWFRLDSLHR